MLNIVKGWLDLAGSTTKLQDIATIHIKEIGEEYCLAVTLADGTLKPIIASQTTDIEKLSKLFSALKRALKQSNRDEFMLTSGMIINLSNIKNITCERKNNVKHSLHIEFTGFTRCFETHKHGADNILKQYHAVADSKNIENNM